MAAHTARELSPFQKEAIIAIGAFGEIGLWTSSPLINWNALEPMMRANGAPSLLEPVPGKSGMARLTPFGQKVRTLLKVGHA